ncbi:CRTAC1 family protein [Nocardia brasiliensis]|uniref:CRTAC1 family protein n=1 Tax=Nocardia brasiliensis TaxID=37326 RepID=UPI0024577251|nr:CRTAC1 family protein [Nocardia brasiliensis]
MKIPIHSSLLRKAVVPAVALLLMGALFVPARSALLPSHDEAGGPIASRFDFTPMPIAIPDGVRTDRKIREVRKPYENLSAWISSVGAAAALNDIDGNRLADDLCMVDVRSDKVYLTPTPDSDTRRYQPFVLDWAPLRVDDATVPSGCVPGDYNSDGRTDLLVHFYGRTPIVLLQRADATRLDAKTFRPIDLVPAPDTQDGGYHGPRWITAAVAVADFDGNGTTDIFLGNYFPDMDVLKQDGRMALWMTDSFSNALNGGGNHIFTLNSARSGPDPSVDYREVDHPFPIGKATGWVLAAAATDLTGDQLPELYVANDFGKDRMFVNRSKPGDIRFGYAEGRRGLTDPKSYVMGHDSNKGMAADFGDLNADGLPDLFVSNIAARFALMEGHFAWYNTAKDTADAAAALGNGVAPFENRAPDVGLAWETWGWDAKIDDFDNDGRNEVVQATGMIKGDTNRWAQIQEAGTMNDDLVKYPQAWPIIGPGADLSGSDPVGFFSQDANGEFANLTHALGLDQPIPSRGIAVGDTTGNGALSFAVARQWADPTFYHNNRANNGRYLGLQLVKPTAPGSPATTVAGLPVLGVPAIDARVEVRTPDGRIHTAHLDGGSGHTGKRATEIHLGLGDVDPNAPLNVRLCWRDSSGVPHEQTIQLTPGRHAVSLTSNAQEVK